MNKLPNKEHLHGRYVGLALGHTATTNISMDDLRNGFFMAKRIMRDTDTVRDTHVTALVAISRVLTQMAADEADGDEITEEYVGGLVSGYLESIETLLQSMTSASVSIFASNRSKSDE